MEGASGIYIPQDFQAREPRTGTGAVLIEARNGTYAYNLRPVAYLFPVQPAPFCLLNVY